MEKFQNLSPENVRKYWEDEEKDFTPWLADDDRGLVHLENVLELDLEVVDTEKSVGNYNLDILARERGSEGGRKIVIENQLTDSDHDHLGKSISYAAGEDADVVVWVAPEFNDEHLDAIQWLNRNSEREIDFFAVKLEVYTIADSPPAVKLTAVEKPSEWQEKAQQSSDNLSELNELQLEYWTELRDKIKESSDTPFSARKPRAQHWYSQTIGKTGMKMNFVVDSRKEQMFCEFLIRDDAEAYQHIRSRKEEIEDRLGDLIWIPPEESETEKDRSKIRLPKDASIYDTDSWEEYQDWMLTRGREMYEVFSDITSEL